MRGKRQVSPGGCPIGTVTPKSYKVVVSKNDPFHFYNELKTISINLRFRPNRMGIDAPQRDGGDSLDHGIVGYSLRTRDEDRRNLYSGSLAR